MSDKTTLLTKKQVADSFQCSEKTISNLVKQGRLKEVKVGNLTRFSVASVNAFILAQGTNANRRFFC